MEGLIQLHEYLIPTQAYVIHKKEVSMNELITKIQAFNAMRKFLEMYYKRTLSDDVGSLLGDLNMITQGETADPAAWDDWNQALENVLKESK
jgi:hypothetical protein